MDLTTYRPKRSPFELFSDIKSSLTDPKIFLKAPLAPIYTYFKGGGERAPKFCGKIFFKNCIKTPFWPDFSKFCLRLKNFKTGIICCSGRARKFNLVDLQKKVEKISKSF